MSKTSWEVKNRYNKKSYDSFLMTMPKGQLPILKSAAEEHDLSVNTLVRTAITEYLKKHYDIDLNEFQKLESETE